MHVDYVSVVMCFIVLRKCNISTIYHFYAHLYVFLFLYVDKLVLVSIRNKDIENGLSFRSFDKNS